jgi:hypothetical protein
MKILFLEDRPSRQKLFLPYNEKDVEKLHSITDVFMPESNECLDIIAKINNGYYQFGENLKLIIVHKSALKTTGLENINQFCKEKKVDLVCFSGGTNQLTYNHDDYEFVNLNSTDLYTKRLIPFLEDVIAEKSETLLELTNKNWQLSYLFLARQIIGSLDLESDDDVKFNFQERLEELKTILKLDTPFTIENINKEIKEKILAL